MSTLFLLNIKEWNWKALPLKWFLNVYYFMTTFPTVSSPFPKISSKHKIKDHFLKRRLTLLVNKKCNSIYLLLNKNGVYLNIKLNSKMCKKLTGLYFRSCFNRNIYLHGSQQISSNSSTFIFDRLFQREKITTVDH